jgi:hypothetical protein
VSRESRLRDDQSSIKRAGGSLVETEAQVALALVETMNWNMVGGSGAPWSSAQR